MMLMIISPFLMLGSGRAGLVGRMKCVENEARKGGKVQIMKSLIFHAKYKGLAPGGN